MGIKERKMCFSEHTQEFSDILQSDLIFLTNPNPQKSIDGDGVYWSHCVGPAVAFLCTLFLNNLRANFKETLWIYSSASKDVHTVFLSWWNKTFKIYG